MSARGQLTPQQEAFGQGAFSESAARQSNQTLRRFLRNRPTSPERGYIQWMVRAVGAQSCCARCVWRTEETGAARLRPYAMPQSA